MRPNLSATTRGRHAPPTLTEAIDWRELAECRPGNGHDPEIWFPNNGNPDPAPIDALQARGICAGCPVKNECLEAELEFEGAARAYFRSGIRGGRTGSERYAIYASRARKESA